MQKCKKLYRGLDMRILTCYNNIMHPGIAKLVSRLVWDQETVRSSRTTRTKSPLKLLISEGFFLHVLIDEQLPEFFITHRHKISPPYRYTKNALPLGRAFLSPFSFIIQQITTQSHKFTSICGTGKKKGAARR